MAKKSQYIKTLQDLIEYLGANDALNMNRRIYKDTGCGASISVRRPGVWTCEKCKAFNEQFRCSAATHLECDCPKCQGYCRCGEQAWLHNGQDDAAWRALTEIDAFTIQTIVEGSDATVDSDTFVLPVKIHDVNRWMEEMEDEADRLWHEANDEQEGEEAEQ